jgi:hypothetical protein
MSDTSDINGPIPLTREDLQVEPVGVLDICFVQLEASQRLAHGVPHAKVLLVFGISRTLPGQELTGNQKGLKVNFRASFVLLVPKEALKKRQLCIHKQFG